MSEKYIRFEKDYCFRYGVKNIGYIRILNVSRKYQKTKDIVEVEWITTQGEVRQDEFIGKMWFRRFFCRITEISLDEFLKIKKETEATK